MFFRLFICSCWQNWAWKLFIWFFLRHGQHFSFCVGGWKKAKVDWNIKIHSGGLLVPRAHSGEGGVNYGKRFWLGNEMQCQAIDKIPWTDVGCLIWGRFFRKDANCVAVVRSCECLINVLLHICLNHQIYRQWTLGIGQRKNGSCVTWHGLLKWHRAIGLRWPTDTVRCLCNLMSIYIKLRLISSASQCIFLCD